MPAHKYTLFIFRRDLRIQDNLALNAAIRDAETNHQRLIFAFTFNKSQVDANEYFSNNAFQFMLECLHALNKDLFYKLSFFDDEEFYKRLDNVHTIAFNLDYTPFARKRDEAVEAYCKAKNIRLITQEDYTLLPINRVLTTSGEPYKVFTPFFNKCVTYSIERPRTEPLPMQTIDRSKGSLRSLQRYTKPANKIIVGGRTEALKILLRVKNGLFDDYAHTRNLPSLEHSTTNLSAYLKFGCVSIREVHDVLKRKYGSRCELIKQLFWKEFYANIAFNFPDVLFKMIHRRSFNRSFNAKYDTVDWSDDDTLFDKWRRGETGFPIVDAGMRQLNQTGFMHNRLRMITASFLIKDLGIDWRRGEQYFATKLVDYDPASNNGGWQWVAGSGTDAAPYFRVFNPWIQARKYDADCAYIIRWIPSLSRVPPKDIHKWCDVRVRTKYATLTDYIAPIVDHGAQKESILRMYKRALKN